MDYNNFLVNAYTKMRILDRNISDGLSKIAPKNNTALSTAYQAVEGFSSSAMKSLESAGDFALQLIAGATKGWLPEVSESVSSFAQRDLVDEGMRYYSEQGKRPLGLLGALAPSVSKQAYDMTSGRNALDDVNVPLTQFTLQDVIDNVGAMLPSVALGVVGGQALSLGMLGTSAAGQATNEALAEGAPIGKALGYGTLSGATEVATEMMVDPFKLFGGSGFFDNILPSTGTLGKLATSFLGEGAEEMVSEVVNPALKSIYQGRTALEKYTTKEGRKELLSDTVQAGIMGGVVSLAMAPLGAVTNTKQNRVAEQYETISNNAKRLTSLDAAGKLTERQRIKMESTTAQAKSRISDLLSSMDAQTRANTIDRLNLSGLFNEDGSVKNVQAGKKAAYQSYGAELNGDLAELANKAQVELAESEDLDENQRETFRQVLKSFAEVKNAGYDVDALAVVKDNGTQQGITIAGANKGGLIFINENRLNEINDALQTLTHELTHSLPKTTAVLTLLDKALTSETMGENLAGTMADIAEEYGWTRDEVTGAVADYRAGKITPENDRIVSELIANFTEDMIGLGGTVTESFNRLVRNDEGLIVRAYNSIRDMIALHKAVGNDSGVTRQAYRDLIGYEKTFRRAMELAGIDVTRLAGEDEEETRYSYIGAKAKTADKSLLTRAEEMERSGADSESIRKETGWFRGMDGEWRFEIDDSKMVYYPSADAEFSKNHPEYRRLVELEYKYIMGDLSQSEFEELQELNEVWGREKGRLSKVYQGGGAKLSDIIAYDELFEAYPQLKDVSVQLSDSTFDYVGRAKLQSNTIELALNKNADKNAIKRTLIHEIQHFIQNYEGYAQGSSTDAWLSRMADYYRSDLSEKRTRLLRVADSQAKDALYLFDESANRTTSTRETRARDYDRFTKDISNEEILNAFYDYAEALDNLQDFYQNGNEIAFSLYNRTAGEIEARDAAQRMNLSEEERKNTRPDIDRTDVVFADGNNTISLYFDENSNNDEKKEILKIINKNIEKINPTEVFDEKSVDIREYKHKSDYVLEVFNKQGNFAMNTTLGRVELVKSGAKSTMIHGFGKGKIAAIPAIKAVIENGNIVGISGNYKNKGYDRYVIASRGKIDGNPAILGVVIKSYKGTINSKFYLHEVEIIEADVSSMTAPQLSVIDTVNTSASTVSISQNSEMSTGFEKNFPENDVRRSVKLTEEEKAKRREERYAKKRGSKFDLDAVNNLIAHKEEIVQESEQAAKLLRSIAVRADKLRGYANQKYREAHNIHMSANLITNEEFKSLAEKVTNIFRDDMIAPQKVRKNISEIAFWFSKDNQIYQDYLNELKYADDNLKENIENDIAESLEILQEGYDKEKGTWKKETLSVQELKAANDILRFVEKFYTRYDTIWEEGKRRSATVAAMEYRIGIENGIKGLELDKNGKPKGINGKLKEYLFGVTSPMTVAKMLDGYADDGFYQHYVERMQKDSWAAQKSAYEVTKDLQDFVKKTKGYKKRLAKERIQIGRYDFLVGEVIDIYLQWTQENGKLTISKGAGINYTTKNGNKSSVSALLSETDMNLIENSFTKEDWKFVNLLKKIYLDGGKIAGEMDMRILGFTDKDSPNYYQLTRDKDFIKGNIGDASRRPDINSVANKSINKKRSKHAKRIPLLAQNAYEKAMRYVHDSTTYGYMAEDLMNFKKIYYRNVSGNIESFRSIRSLTQQAWNKSNEYWSKYLNDVQGVKSGTTSEIVSWIRSGYAQANLGMNIKVIFGQFASYPTAGVYLSTTSMLKGVFSKTDYAKLDEYSMIAKVRGRDRVVVKAETVTDTLNAVGKYGTLGIQWADRGTIGKVWNACQYEIESQNHLKRGTDENYKAAAELFDRIVTETQPTQQDADRSAFQRSDKEMAKFFSAFTSVPMKQISLLVSAYDEIRSLKQQKKNHVEISDERLQTAKKKAAKTTVAIIEANLMYALLVQLSKTLLKRDDPEDNTIKLFPGFEMKWYWQIAEQFINTNISMFPVGKELYGWLIHGYEIEGVNPMSSVNGFLSDIQVLRNADSIEDLRKGAKNVSMDLGVMFGVPVRNTYNLIYGLIKRVDAATTEQIDAYFTEKKAYAAKIGKAVEDGDERLLNTYLKIQSGQGNLPEIYNRLTMMGYDVLPRSVGTTFTYNGETYRMTNAERKQFREIYYQYSTVVSNMTRTKLWGNVSDDVKASAINLVQNTYWDLARDEITGEGDSNKVILFSEAIPIAKLCVAVAACRAMESDKDKKGNTIPGSKKVKVQKLVNSLDMTIPQKYMLMSFLGYKNVNGEKVVKAYINTLKGLSKAEKVQLGELCGVAA